MPFFKTYEVPREFFKLFLKQTTKKPIPGDSRLHPMLSVSLFTGEVKDFMVRYYNRSGESGVEDVKDYYPCVVIQDFQPELDRTKLWGKDYVEGFIDLNTGTREYITLPVPMKYMFQVSVVTRRLKDVQSYNDWFMQNFSLQRPDCFLMNEFDTEEGKIGDVVPYKVNFVDTQRDDGKFEYVYTFYLDTYIYAKSKNYKFVQNEDGSSEKLVGGTFQDLIEKVTLILTTMDYEQFREVISDGFVTTPTDSIVVDMSNDI